MAEIVETRELRVVQAELEEQWMDKERCLSHVLELIRMEKLAGNGHLVLEELPAWLAEPRAVVAPVEEETEEVEADGGGGDGSGGRPRLQLFQHLTPAVALGVSVLALALDASPFDPFGTGGSLTWSPACVLVALLVSIPSLLNWAV